MKRRCKLFQVVFPARSSNQAPPWLEWSDDEWLQHRNDWYTQLDEIYDIRKYMDNFFLTETHLQSAAREVAACSPESKLNSSFAGVEAAMAWQRRVQQWEQNLLQDLQRDSVQAPGSADVRWLFFRSSSLQVSTDDGGAISCSLCKLCRSALRRVKGDAKKSPHVRMPEYARANGLWHGPDPEELRELSYAECKVINLARIYVSVKRIFLDRSSYVSCSILEDSQKGWGHALLALEVTAF